MADNSISILLVLLCLAGKHYCDIITDENVFFTAKSNYTFFINTTESWVNGDILRPTLYKISSFMKTSSGVAYDYHLRSIILSDPGWNSIFILNASSVQGVIYHFGTSDGVGQLGVDWRAHNVYWTDSVYGWIAMQRLPSDIRTHNSFQTSFRLVVEKYLHTPTGIAVYPEKYYLFWADAGPQPKIERSDLAGGDRTIITWEGLITPTSLCIDQSNERLYWTDASRGTVEFSDFDGLHRTIITSDSQKHYYGIAVFKDSIIVTNPISSSVEVYNKMNGEYVTHFQKADGPLYSALVYNPGDQLRDEPEGCDRFECDHICAHMEFDRGYTCLCDDGYELELDGKTCSAETNVLERFILYTNDTSICAISINAINSFRYVPLRPICDVITHHKRITKFALDMTNDIIFYTDGKGIFKDQAYNNDTEHIADGDDVTDLDYNWKTGELVWIDKSDGKIYALNVNENEAEKREMVEDLNSPTSVAVDPHDRRIYWVSKDGMSQRLYYMKEDGTVMRVASSFLKNPTDLEYDRLNERLFWSDKRGYLGMINVDGTSERTIDIVDKIPEALSVFKKYVLCSDSTADLDALTVIQEPEDTQWVIRSEFLASTHISDLHVFDSSLQPSDLEPCEENNGGCEQLCLPQDSNRCACYLGYELDSDGFSCITTTSDTNFYLITDSLYESIYQMDTDSDSIRGVPIEKDNEPTSTSFDANTNMLYWIDSKSKSLKMRDIHGVKETSLGTDVSESSSIAVDVTGGNVYVTRSDGIFLFTPSNDVKTLIRISDIKGQPGKIALKPSSGIMIWIETGANTRIVKANMDGTTMKEVVADDIDTPTEIVVDHNAADNANVMYWSDKALHKIEKVDLDSLTSDVVYTNQELQIIAIDVKDDYIFFIAEGQRKIIRIDKNDGSGYQVVKESALLGQLSTLYVWKPAPAKHESCSGCTNGGCSTICLPRSDGRTCACADRIALGSDIKTCTNVDRCSTELAEYNIKNLDPCCIPISSRFCNYTCKDGYQKQLYALECKANGRWNQSIAEACLEKVIVTPAKATDPDPDNGNSGTAVIGGGIGGGVVIAILIVVVIIIVYRRRQKNAFKRNRLLSVPSIGDVNPSGGSLDSQSPVYNDSMFRPDLPPRSLTDEEEADGGVYHDLDESMIAKTVDLPPEKTKGIAKDSQRSDRYSTFPQARQSDDIGLRTDAYDNEKYYLDPCPAPDYDTDHEGEVGLTLDNNAPKKFQADDDDEGYMMSVSFKKKNNIPRLAKKHMEENYPDTLPGYNDIEKDEIDKLPNLTGIIKEDSKRSEKRKIPRLPTKHSVRNGPQKLPAQTSDTREERKETDGIDESPYLDMEAKPKATIKPGFTNQDYYICSARAGDDDTYIINPSYRF